MEKEKVYPDYEPEKIIFKGITQAGKEIIFKGFLDEDRSIVNIIHLNTSEDTIKKDMATHIKCPSCGKIYKKDYYSICQDCRNKKEIEEYNNLVVVPLSFPCFVNDEFIADESELEDYIALNEIEDTSTLQIYPADKLQLKIDLVDHITDYLCDMGYEDSIEELLPSKEYEDLLILSSKINSILNSIQPSYESDMSKRMVYCKEGKNN